MKNNIIAWVDGNYEFLSKEIDEKEVEFIQEKLKLTHHHLKHEIIQNALVTFLLELSNIWIENHWNLLDEPYQSDTNIS